MEVSINPNKTQTNAPETFNVPENINVSVEVRQLIQTKIEALKAKANIKKIFVILVPGDEEAGEKPLYVGYFRRPNMMEFSQYMSFVQKDIVQANRMLSQNIFLDGDKELVDDDDMFLFGTMPQLNGIIDARNGALIKK